MKPTQSAYLPRGFQFWPDDAIDLQVEKVVELYSNGFAGAYLDDVAKGEFEDFITSQSFGNLDGDAVAHANGLTGTGEGRLVIPYVFAMEYYPDSLPGAAQEVGDCFPAGTRVRMADGSEKPIEEVQIGELVLSGKGRIRRVIDTIAKDYEGTLVSFQAKGYAERVESTPDHQFVQLSLWGLSEWTAAAALNDGDDVLLPRINLPEREIVYDLARVVEHGLAVQVKDIRTREFFGKVYCIGVEEDHSFIANGYAAHNCVSHSSKNSGFITFCCDIKSGKPDEETGIVEGAPVIPEAGILQGALSSEAIYWYRGYDGHGWQCEKAAQVVCQDSALWIRQPYPELGLDLTKYSGKLASKYGQRKPPEEITQTGRKHLIRTSTRVKTFEEVRDFLANGYGISTCGSEGFSSTRDENGVSARKGSWSHAMALIGADDREETKRRYNGPLVLVQNSWGKFNRGSRRILGTDIDIPEGSFWARWSDVQRRSMLAFSGANGWPAKKLPAINFIVG